MSDDEKKPIDDNDNQTVPRKRVVDATGKTKGRVRYNPGRVRKSFPFEVARELARKENLGSVKQYLQWHKYNKPARMPKRPDRAYHKDFISWNDFLGNDNKFAHGQYLYKTYEESKKFARTLNLKTQFDWTNYGREVGLPEGIPTRPDLFYQKTFEWYTWAEFLGSSVQTIINEANDTERVVYIVRYNSTPMNVYQIGMVKSDSDVYGNQKSMGFAIIKLYGCNANYPLSATLDALKLSMYTDGEYDNMYIVENYYDVVHALENAGVLRDITI